MAARASKSQQPVAPKRLTAGWPVAGAALADIDPDHGRGGVSSIQRARMIAAMAEIANERGAGQATVAHVVARSGVSRRTFYELFEDREACFLAAFDEAVQRAARDVLPAFRAARNWRERIRAGLCALLEFLDDEPGLGGLCVVDALGAGPPALARRAEVVRALVDAVDAGRSEAKGGLTPTRLTAEGVVGAVLGVLHARLVEPAQSPNVVEPTGATRRRDTARARSLGSKQLSVPTLVDLLGPLMGMIVLPYQGAAAAAREIARPAPPSRPAARVQSDPLRDLDMRLTYRTVRVLVAIATHPGSSNREIAGAAGVQDQGQISKLLARLEHLGLVENYGAGPARGEPNAWRLTARGHEIEHAIREQTAPILA